jgi:hypothetical protein
MTTDKTTRWVALSALAMASMALGLSLAAGCKREVEMRPEQGAALPMKAPAAPASVTAPESHRASSEAAREPAAAPTARAAAPKGGSATAEAAPPASPIEAGLKVRRLVVARHIEGREPAESGTRFTPDGAPLFAFVELENASPDTQQIVVTFERAGGPSLGNVKLDVPAKNARYRTWGQTRRIRNTGTWQAVVRTPSGQELARQAFEVQT